MKKISSPKENAADKFLTGGKAFIGIMPAGSLATYLLDQIIKPPVQERIKEWMETVSASLNEHVSDIQSLKDNQRFITSFIQASQIASRNHQEDKLKVLHNAAINSIPGPSYFVDLILDDLQATRADGMKSNIFVLIGQPTATTSPLK